MIVSNLPGRVRVRFPRPLTEEEAAMVAQAVKDLDPAAELDFGRRNASLLARCRKDAETGQALCELLNAHVARCSSMAASKPKPPETISMATVKKGMTLGLGGSLALLAMRSERGHAIAGGVFLGFLARHLWVYRKRVWMP